MTNPQLPPFEQERGSATEIRFLRRKLETTEVAMLHAENFRSAYDAKKRQLDLMADAVQRYLPSTYPVLNGLAAAGHCRPCADMGGDFYDATILADGRVALCMADVSGHGAVAAILMASTRALLRASLHELKSGEGPAIAMQRLSRWLSSELLDTEFVTMWLGIFDPAGSELRFASSAHPEAVIWRSGVDDPEFLPVNTGFPLGLAGLPAMLNEEAVVEFNLGDRLFLYTDGWTESESSDGHTLVGPDLLDFFANSAGQSTEVAPTLLFTEFERHLADSKVRDDVSLLVVDRL